MISKITRIFCIVIICSFCFACGLDEAVNYMVEGCDESGAYDLAEEHREILEFAGWLEYVESNVGRIDYYYDRSASHEGAVGYAHCKPGECYIEIAAKNRTDVEIATTIVHEAGHLEDNCENGEYLPQKVERAFVKDFYSKVDSGVFDSKKLSASEITAPGRILDYYPSPQNNSIALITADNPANEIQTNLYVFQTDTGIVNQISDFSDKEVKFVRQYSDYSYSRFSFRLKNPWSPSGDRLAVSVKNSENQYDILLLDIYGHTQKKIYTGWSASGAVFSPDEKYMAVSSLHVVEPVVIIDIEMEESFKSLPKQYNNRDGVMHWVNNEIMALYNKDSRQIEAYNIVTDTSHAVYKLKGEETLVDGIYAFGDTPETFYAMMLTTGASRRVYKMNLSEYELLLDDIDNTVVPAVPPSGRSIAYYINPSDDNSYGRKLIIKNLTKGEENTYLDRFIDKDRAFFLSEDILLMSTLHSPEDSSAHDYRLWMVELP